MKTRRLPGQPHRGSVEHGHAQEFIPSMTMRKRTQSAIPLPAPLFDYPLSWVYTGLMEAFLITIAVLVLVLILWFEVAMFLDVIRNKKLSENEKILWVLGMFLLHPIIAIVYYFVAHSRLNTR